jgi:hypothetical protein
MDHTEAETSQSVERYLLGQMTESENESFEKHFFECAACAAEVEAGVLFQENARAAFASEPKPAQAQWNWFPAWWRRPAFAAPAFAALVLAGAAIYQGGWVIPALRQELAQLHLPQAVPAFAVKAATRGEESRITIPAGTRSFLINLDLADNAFPSYQCGLSFGSGPVRWSFDSPAPQAGNPLSIIISAAGLQPGVYTLRVHGLRGSVAGPEIASYSFLLQLD